MKDKIIVGVLILVVVQGVFWGGYYRGVNATKAKMDKAIVVQQAKAMQLTNDMVLKLSHKEREVQNEKKIANRAVADSRTELDRLRNTISTAKLSEASNASSGDVSPTARSGDILIECATEYTEMGSTAEELRHRASVAKAYAETIKDMYYE